MRGGTHLASVHRIHGADSDRSARVWHPSAQSGRSGRVVAVTVKAVDPVSLWMIDYAERIPAARRYGLHATCGATADVVRAEWRTAVPEMPLEIVEGDDVASALAANVTDELADPDVNEVVVLLCGRRLTGARASQLPRVVSALRELAGVAPIVLPPVQAGR
jgi:hypothetical protein